MALWAKLEFGMGMGHCGSEYGFGDTEKVLQYGFTSRVHALMYKTVSVLKIKMEPLRYHRYKHLLVCQ